MHIYIYICEGAGWRVVVVTYQHRAEGHVVDSLAHHHEYLVHAVARARRQQHDAPSHIWTWPVR